MAVTMKKSSPLAEDCSFYLRLYGIEMKWIIAGLMVFASAAAHAETLGSPDAVREFTEKVMEKISAGDLDGGFAMMKEYSIVAGAEMDALAAKLKRSQSVVSPVYGKSIGHELIKMDTLGTSAIRII